MAEPVGGDAAAGAAPDAAHTRRRILDCLADAGVRFAASLPDDWVSPLIEDVDADERFTHVRVAREAEIIGLCAGAFFAGQGSVAIMGLAGVLAVVHEIATLNLMHGIPLLLLTSRRGGLTDHQVYQVVQGQVGAPVIEALGLGHHVVARAEDVDELVPAVTHARLLKKPLVVSLPRELLR